MFAKYYYNNQGKLAQQGKYNGLQVSLRTPKEGGLLKRSSALGIIILK
jgi:hypothetical protein